MVKKIVVFCLIFYSYLTQAQSVNYQYTIVDRFCDCPEMAWNDEHYELKDISLSKNEIELRINWFDGRFKTVAILTKNQTRLDAFMYFKDTALDSFSYSDSLAKYGKWEMVPYMKFRVKDRNLDSLYTKLLQHHIASLPEMKDIYKGPFLSSCHVECKLGDIVTRYAFGSLEKLMKLEPNNKIFKEYYSIARIVDSLLSGYYSFARDTADKRSILLAHKRELDAIK